MVNSSKTKCRQAIVPNNTFPRIARPRRYTFGHNDLCFLYHPVLFSTHRASGSFLGWRLLSGGRLVDDVSPRHEPCVEMGFHCRHDSDLEEAVSFEHRLHIQNKNLKLFLLRKQVESAHLAHQKNHRRRNRDSSNTSHPAPLTSQN